MDVKTIETAATIVCKAWGYIQTGHSIYQWGTWLLGKPPSHPQNEERSPPDNEPFILVEDPRNEVDAAPLEVRVAK